MISLKTTKSKIPVIVLACAALVIAGAGVYFLLTAMLNEYDPIVKHFDFKHFNATAAVCLCAAGAVLAVAGFFTAPKKLTFSPSGKKYTFAGVFGSILAGLTCALFFGFGVKEGLPKEKPGILLAELTFTILSAAYFFLKASGLFAKKPVAALSGLLPSLMCAFILLNLYFNTADPLNAPLKIFESVMLVAFMLYFTAETGVLILRPRMNRKYLFAGLFAVSSGGMVALSKIAARIIDPDTFGGDIVRPAFFAIIWVYIAISFAEKVIALREKTKEEALLDIGYGKKEKEDKSVEEEEENGYFDVVTALPADDDSEEDGGGKSGEYEDGESDEEKPDEEPAGSAGEQPEEKAASEEEKKEETEE